MIITLTVLSLAITANAAERTLIDGSFQFGGFGAPAVMYSRFNGVDGVLVGGQGAFVVNHLLYLGGAGYGFATRVPAPDALTVGNGQNMRYDFGYGGALVGVVFKSDYMLHLTADALIGGGAITWTDNAVWEDEENDWNRNHRDAFFFVQPMVHAELNLTTWLRADLGAGYRFVNGVTINDLSNNDAAGPVAGLSLRFGTF
jgi:hypothetical protein